MTDKNQIIDAFVLLGKDIKDNINSVEYLDMMQKAEIKNPWFEKSQTKQALLNFLIWFDKNILLKELNKYDFDTTKSKILIVCAGNIPAVAFHDILCVLLSGNKAVIKLSSNDDVIIPFLLDRLVSILPQIQTNIEYVSSDFVQNISDIDGVIATGSNSSSLLFEQYFRNIPHIIRKSRYSVAIIQSDDDISGLEDDICMFFGQGCRSISHLFVPKSYVFDLLVEKLSKYSCFLNHNKYRNNFDYQRAIMIMNNIPFIEAKPIILRENTELYSPLSVVNYSYYDDIKEVEKIISWQKDNLQCVTGNNLQLYTPFGKNQQPNFTDYADNVNTLDWIYSIKNK